MSEFKQRYGNNSIWLVICMASGILFIHDMNRPAFSQQIDMSLERRIEKLENYVATFQPTIVELSENLNTSIQEYTQGLESSLEGYSQKLQMSLDERLNNIDRKVVIMNPFSKVYQSIETNTGIFLISVEKVEPIEGGVRLHLNIGNPNYADYQNFKLKLIWGQKWADGYGASLEEWRQSLNGVEYTFQGKIEKGMWNPVTVDLSPAGDGQLGYLECEMEVSSVELGFKQ
jgi:uncharacterized coiled-coil protein SlyX